MALLLSYKQTDRYDLESQKQNPGHEKNLIKRMNTNFKPTSNETEKGKICLVWHFETWKTLSSSLIY